MLEGGPEVDAVNAEFEDIQQLRAFQDALRPRAVKATAFAQLHAGFTPADGPVGGDFHDHLEIGRDRQVAVIGDVTGHGLPSALVMAVAFGAIREAFRSTQLPCAVVNGLHGLLAQLGERSGGPRLFSASLFLGVIEADGALTYVNAGHPPALILRRSGETERLDAGVPPLGLAEPVACRSVPQGLSPGDRLVLYTDGLLRPDEGIAELIERVRRLAGLDAPSLVERLLVEGAQDDRTVMVLSYRGPGFETAASS